MSLDADASRALAAWRAPDAAAERLRRLLLSYLAAHPDAAERTGEPAHLTATALVVDPVTGRVLLTLHPRVGLWLPTGGHCEPGDATLAAAALREAREESGIEGLTASREPAALAYFPDECRPGVAHLDVQYLAWAPAGAVERISSESQELRWFAPDALPERTDHAVRHLAARASDLGRAAQGGGSSWPAPAAAPSPAAETPSR